MKLSLRKIGSSKSAFTLIEVMVAMVILAIGALGLLGITILVFRNNFLSQQITEATNLATDLMENTKATLNSLDQADFEDIDCVLEEDPSDGILSPDYYAVTSGSPPSCDVLTTSGLEPQFFPPPRDGNAQPANLCVVSGLLGQDGGADTTYDVSDAGGAVAAVPPAYFCTLSADLERDEYIRYYRVSENAADPTIKDIIVIVMFRDRFNKFRFIRLNSTLVN